MITDLIVTAMLGCLDAVFGLFPAFTMPDSGTYTGALSWGLAFDGIFPVRTLFVCVAAAFGIELVLRLWDLTVFVYHQFWGSD